jgi:molybdopterin converting factor small subunit
VSEKLTINVKVKFHGTFYSVVGTDSLMFKLDDSPTLQDLLTALEAKFGQAFAEHTKRLDYLVMFVNDKEYRQLQGLRTRLSEGDVITLGHVVGGG